LFLVSTDITFCFWSL